MRFFWNCLLAYIISDWAVDQPFIYADGVRDQIGFWLAAMMVLVAFDIFCEDAKEAYEKRVDDNSFPYVLNRRRKGGKRRRS